MNDTQADTQAEAVSADTARHLLIYLQDSGAPCPVCEYHLHQLAEPRCPECGTELHLTVGATLPRLTPWTSAVVWFAMGMGFDAVVSLLWLVMLIPAYIYGFTNATAFQLFFPPAALLVAAAVCFAGIVWLLRFRPRWTLRRSAVQWWRSAGVFLGVALFHVGVAVAIAIVR